MTSVLWSDKLGLDIPPEELEYPEDSVQDVSISDTEILEAAEKDLNFLAGLIMPTVFQYFFPAEYIAIYEWLKSYVHKQRDFSQLALGLPRGFAKTTFVKIFLFYVIVFTKRKFVLVCAHSQEKANAILSDLRDFLEEPNVKKVFGDWNIGVESDNAKMIKFGYRGRNIILAASTVASARGINVKHQRPDIMLFDDIQSREDADSEPVSKQIETDMIGTAMKSKSPHGCLFIFVGNMYPTKHSILRKLKHNPGWVKFIAGGILSDGTSLWEELQPIAQLLQEFQNDLASGHPEAFFAEVMNDENASVNTLIDLSKLPPYPYCGEEYVAGKFIIIDPANNKAHSDNVAIGYCEIIGEKPVLREVISEQLSPGDTIKRALTLALKYNCRLIAVESNSYQYSLLYWFGYICTQHGIEGIDCVDIYSGNLSKPTRIMAAFKELLAAEILVHPSCTAVVNNEIVQYNPARRDNIDGVLDLLTYMTKVVVEYGQAIFASNTIEAQEYLGVEVASVEETSPF